MKHFCAVLIFILSISLHAEVIDEFKWIEKLNQQDQTIAILFIRNKFNKHLIDVIIPNLKTADDYLWFEEISANALHGLSQLSSKNKDLMNKLSQESDVFLQHVHGKISIQQFKQVQPIKYQQVTDTFNKIDNNKLKFFFEQHHKQLDKSSNALIILSKIIATEESINNDAGYIAKKITKGLQGIIDDNNGMLKVAGSTYLDGVFSYKDSVNLGFTIHKQELLTTIMERYDYNIDEATSLIESKEYVDNLNSKSSESLHNAYCNMPDVRKALSDRVKINVNISWDNGTPLLLNSPITEKSCQSRNL